VAPNGQKIIHFSIAITGLFMHKGIISVVLRVELISDRMLYIILRGRWCNIIVLNMHAPCEDEGVM
jgi:hypothetical protein